MVLLGVQLFSLGGHTCSHVTNPADFVQSFNNAGGPNFCVTESGADIAEEPMGGSWYFPSLINCWPFGCNGGMSNEHARLVCAQECINHNNCLAYEWQHNDQSNVRESDVMSMYIRGNGGMRLTEILGVHFL